MTEPKSLDEIIAYAIESEEEAAAFYDDLATKVKQPGVRTALEGFAREERGHKARLEKLKADGKLETMQQRDIPDLKVSDYVVDMTPTPDMSYEDALVIAMQREKAAYKMYTDLAARAANESARKVFLALAQEEAKHKLHFEIEYDESLTEN